MLSKAVREWSIFWLLLITVTEQLGRLFGRHGCILRRSPHDSHSKAQNLATEQNGHMCGSRTWVLVGALDSIDDFFIGVCK